MDSSIKYKIVNLDTVPIKYRMNWREIIDPLPLDKAIQFDYNDRAQAYKAYCSISQSLRNNRINGYKLHTRRIPNGKMISLYVWKEGLTKEVKNVDIKTKSK